jgi:hypothetical protein
MRDSDEILNDQFTDNELLNIEVQLDNRDLLVEIRDLLKKQAAAAKPKPSKPTK